MDWRTRGEPIPRTRLPALGMAAGSAAHEIRNQLVPVKTLLDVLPERVADADLLAQCELALEELRKAIDLVGDLPQARHGVPRDAAGCGKHERRRGGRRRRSGAAGELTRAR